MMTYTYAFIVCICPYLLYAEGQVQQHRFIRGECDVGWYKCQTGTTSYNSQYSCILKSWICDDGKDCADGSDEKYCPYEFDDVEIEIEENTTENRRLRFPMFGRRSTTPKSTSSEEVTRRNSFRFVRGFCPSSNMVMCESGLSVPGLVGKITHPCILKNWICDNDTDCLDRSDEKYCPYNFNLDLDINSNRFVQGDCQDGWIKCEQGDVKGEIMTGDNCIKNEWICDDDYDCIDKSDEKYCSHNHNEDEQEYHTTTTPSPPTPSPPTPSPPTPSPPTPSRRHYNPAIHDEVSLFSQKVGMKMRDMHLTTYLQAERLINQVLYQAQIDNLTSLTQLHSCNP